MTRRTIYELRKARERAHILEGLAVALANIDPVIALIKSSKNPAEAKEALVQRDWAPGAVTQLLAKKLARYKPVPRICQPNMDYRVNSIVYLRFRLKPF